MKNGWRKNFRANLRLWPKPTPNLRDIAELDGQTYDEALFVEHLSGGTAKKHPTSTRAVRQTVEALALAGLGYRDDTGDRFRLTQLGKAVFSELAKSSPDRLLLARMVANALVEVAEYRAILSLMIKTGNHLSNEELNRAMPHIRFLNEVDAAAKLILKARDKQDVGSVGPQEYPGEEQRKAINPWFLLAGGGGLLISISREADYRRIDSEVLPIVKAALARPTAKPVFVSTYVHPTKGTGFVRRLSDAGFRHKGQLASSAEAQEDAPGPAVPPKDFGAAPPDDDPDKWQNYARRVRRGQPKFRNRLLILYAGRCAISGHGPESVLQAAHILPHSETGHNHQDNGLLLRADLHELLDEGLLFIEPTTLLIRLNPSLRGTPYWCFEGTKIRDRVDGSTPSSKYLQAQWKKRSP